MSCSKIFYYHPISPPSRAVWMTIRALGVELKEEIIDFFHGQNRSEEYLKINPRGRIPALVDGDLKLNESAAMMLYLCNVYGEKNPTLYPREMKEQAIVNMVLHANHEYYSNIFAFANPLETLGGKDANKKGPKQELKDKVLNALGVYEAWLEDKPYIAGKNLTIADFNVLITVGLLDLVDFDYKGNYPNIREWYTKMSKLPYYKETYGTPMEQFIDIYQKALPQNQ